MKNWYLFLVSIAIMSNVQAIITDKVIIDSVPASSQPLLNKTIYSYGDNHRDHCTYDELAAQTQKFMDIFTHAESIPEMRYHVLIESFFASCRRHGVLADLLKRVKAKNFNNTVIEDVNHVRTCMAAACFILEENQYDPARTKKDLDEENWIEQVKNMPLFFEVVPPHLQVISLGDSSEKHEARIACFTQFELQYKKRYFFNKAMYPVSVKATLEEAEKIGSVLYELRNIALTRESFNVDLRTVTLQDVYNAAREYITLCWFRYGELQDSSDERVFKEVLEEFMARLDSSIEFFSRRVDKDKSLVDQIINFNGYTRNKFSDQLVDMNTLAVDLEIFYKIIMLEKKQEVEKIIIISGINHMERVKTMLEKTKRYRCLLHEKTPQLFGPHWGGNEGEINVPLRIYIFELVQSPRKNLEWEIFLRTWLFPILHQFKFVK